MRRHQTYNRILRIFVCALISAAIILSLPLCGLGRAAYASDSGTDSSGSETASYTTATRLTVSGYDMTFKKAVVTDQQLSQTCRPSSFTATGKSKSIKLSWSKVSGDISGYCILRKDATGSRWRQIAAVGRNTTSYTDKKAKARNRSYQYLIVAYKSLDGCVMISNPAPKVWAVTTRSKKKNVYKVTINKPTATSAVRVGGSAKYSIKFPKKAYSTNIRWSSSNSAVAKVDKNGRVTGVSKGTAVITGRLHTGRTFSARIVVVEPGTAEGMLDVMRSWLGASTLNGRHKGIIDIYNSVTPIPVGYKMKYSDAWCDATISAASIVSGCTAYTDRECSVDRHIDLFRYMGIWEEDGTIVPEPGDLIVYSWRIFRQPNNKEASHIGIVESVTGSGITVIEGNKGLVYGGKVYGSVQRRTIPVGWGYIRGYARPRYREKSE